MGCKTWFIAVACGSSSAGTSDGVSALDAGMNKAWLAP